MSVSRELDQPTASSLFSTISKAVTQSAVAYRYPALMLWAMGMFIIVGYFSFPPIHRGLEWIGSIKTEFGWIFSMVSTATFGGFLPTLIPWLFGKTARPTLALIGINSAFWAYKGFEIDLFYQTLSYFFGDQLNASTVAMKSLVDMTLYAPLWGLLNVMLFLYWQQVDYSFARFKRMLGKHWYRKLILPALVTGWCVWLPASAMIYCLPPSLQLPVQNLILCFWVLVLALFSETGASDPQGEMPR